MICWLMLLGGESPANVAAAITSHPSSGGAFVCLCVFDYHFVSRV